MLYSERDPKGFRDTNVQDRYLPGVLAMEIAS